MISTDLWMLKGVTKIYRLFSVINKKKYFNEMNFNLIILMELFKNFKIK